MVKAKIKTKWGSTIIIEGIPIEVSQILNHFQRRENFLYVRKLIEEEDVSPKEEVENLIENGFLNEFKTLPEIRKEIYKHIKKIIPNSSLHPTLMRLIAQRKLKRDKLETGLWGYKAVATASKDQEEKKEG